MDITSNMSLQHGKHNKEVFNYLRSSPNKRYYDWEITTAFYSALQYVNGALFPDNYEDPYNGQIRKFSSFEEYYSRYKGIDNDTNKHRLLQQLVDEHLQDVRDDYRTLKDNCWTARYKNYQIEEEIADLAKECLENICEVCEPLEL